MNSHDLQALYELLSSLPEQHIAFILRVSRMSEIELDTMLQLEKLMKKIAEGKQSRKDG